MVWFSVIEMLLERLSQKKREKLEPYLKKLEDKLACMDPADLSAHLNGVTPKLQRTLMDRLTHAQVLGMNVSDRV